MRLQKQHKNISKIYIKLAELIISPLLRVEK